MDWVQVLREVIVNGVNARLEEHHSDSGNFWLEVATYNEKDEPVEQYMVEVADLNCYYGHATMLDALWDEFFDDIVEWRLSRIEDEEEEDEEECPAELTIEDKVNATIQQIRKVLAEADKASGGKCAGIVVADYTREEFEELKPGENWLEFAEIQTSVAEKIKELGIADRVILHPVDSVKYYKFLAENKLENNQASISYFAAVDYQKSQEEK